MQEVVVRLDEIGICSDGLLYIFAMGETFHVCLFCVLRSYSCRMSLITAIAAYSCVRDLLAYVQSPTDSYVLAVHICNLDLQN